MIATVMDQPLLPFVVAAVAVMILGVLRVFLALIHLAARWARPGLRRGPAGPVIARAFSGAQWLTAALVFAQIAAMVESHAQGATNLAQDTAVMLAAAAVFALCSELKHLVTPAPAGATTD